MDPISDNLELNEIIDGNEPRIFRAIVKDTNDPLNMRRVQIFIPQLHDENMNKEHFPWATQLESSGGKGVGSFANYCIEDVVLVLFENGELYTPIIVGSSKPTMLNHFPIESTYLRSDILPPHYIKNEESVVEKINEAYKEYFKEIEDYLPKDQRPMSWGHKDRYGNTVILNSVGFFPIEHIEKPEPHVIIESENDPEDPEPNSPDTKYMALISKYGNYIMLGDQGYEWQDKDKFGEFSGDFNEDYEFELKRSENLIKLLNENSHKVPHDQRRIELRTRYGHLLQMRDVGWNKTREYEEIKDTKIISKHKDLPELWFKLKTKGGHLIEMIDNGFDLEDDIINRSPLEEDPRFVDKEMDFDNDARMIRFITRGVAEYNNGSKIVLDDRVRTTLNGEVKKSDYNYGILIKTSRSILENEGRILRGFGIELNDRNNHLQIYSPNKQAIEIDDDAKAITLSSGLNLSQSLEYKGKSGNEFNPNKIEWENTFHLRLNDKNKYIKLKGPNNDGFELKNSAENKFIDIRENDERGLFLSETDKVTVLRGDSNQKFIAIDDKNNIMFIYHDNKIQIYSKGNIEFIADGNIELKADGGIKFNKRPSYSGVDAEIARIPKIKPGE